jgi:lactoylglutathione lyase
MTSNDEARLGWVILYVSDPGAAVAFYERAFGMTRRFVAEGNSYAELATGSTTLAFAAHELGDGNLPGGFQRPQLDSPPFNVELALVFDDVTAGWRRALDAGCTALAAPARKPQGQTVGYVRDPFGTLIEIASPLDAEGAT